MLSGHLESATNEDRSPSCSCKILCEVRNGTLSVQPKSGHERPLHRMRTPYQGSEPGTGGCRPVRFSRTFAHRPIQNAGIRWSRHSLTARFGAYNVASHRSTATPVGGPPRARPPLHELLQCLSESVPCRVHCRRVLGRLFGHGWRSSGHASRDLAFTSAVSIRPATATSRARPIGGGPTRAG